MTPYTESRIKSLAETLYRAATFEESERDTELKEWDQPALEAVERLLTEIIKNQDKITRHACAEAVITLEISGSHYLVETDLKQRAHQACMNVQAI